MSSPPSITRRFGAAAPALLLGAFLLGACGFQPLYGGGANGVAAELASVEIGTIPDRLGQRLRNELIDRFNPAGRPAASAYKLDIGLTSSQVRLGFQKDATATRAQVMLGASYQLRDGSGNIVHAGRSESIVGYSIITDPYGTLVNEQDAYDQATVQLAEDITRRLSLYLKRG